ILANGVPDCGRVTGSNRAASVIEPDQCVQFDEDRRTCALASKLSIQPAIGWALVESLHPKTGASYGGRCDPLPETRVHRASFVHSRQFSADARIDAVLCGPCVLCRHCQRGVGMWHEACLRDSELHMEFKR